MNTLKTGRFLPRIEALEDRLALSWAGVPPSSITPPTNPVEINFNGNLIAKGNGSIDFNEVDWYSFTAPESGRYVFRGKTPTSSLDTVLGVFSSAGARLAYNDDITQTNTDSKFTLTLLGGNRYYLGITNYTGTAGGAYKVKVDRLTAIDDVFENNDTRAEATNLGTLGSRQTWTGLKMMDDTRDWYRFEMTSAGTSADYVKIDFLHAQGDLELRLYDAAGTFLRASSTVNNSERISLDELAAGAYFVQVYSYADATNPNYSLEIEPG